MPEFLYHISDAAVFAFMVITTITFSLLLIILNKYFIFYKLKYRNNTITASVGSLIGIIYGVLIGFVCLFLLNNNDHASTAALNEGISAANIYRDSNWLKEPERHQIRQDLRKYIDAVINVEWPAMTSGKNPGVNNGYIISDISNRLITYPIVTQNDALILRDIVQEIKSLFNARQERIQMSVTNLSSGIWLVLIIGTILIIVINYAYRVSYYLHIFSITTFSIMAASVLFLLVTLDRPFQGEFVVEPTALQAVLDTMNHDLASTKLTAP